MTSLYNRASPPQRRVLRIVEGAVKNAADAHGAALPHRFARSVAKRAAGTLTAQWPDVLAAKPSDRATSESKEGRSATSKLVKARRRGPAHGASRSPFRLLYRQVGAMAGEARRHGQAERAEALADALRTISSVQKELGS